MCYVAVNLWYIHKIFVGRNDDERCAPVQVLRRRNLNGPLISGNSDISFQVLYDFLLVYIMLKYEHSENRQGRRTSHGARTIAQMR